MEPCEREAICGICTGYPLRVPDRNGAESGSRHPWRAQNLGNAPPPEVRIDINHATVDELLKVPGMTRSWAGRIVRFRPYRTKTDLLEHGVVTGEVYDRIKDYVIAHRDKQ